MRKSLFEICIQFRMLCEEFFATPNVIAYLYWWFCFILLLWISLFFFFDLLPQVHKSVCTSILTIAVTTDMSLCKSHAAIWEQKPILIKFKLSWFQLNDLQRIKNLNGNALNRHITYKQTLNIIFENDKYFFICIHKCCKYLWISNTLYDKI